MTTSQNPQPAVPPSRWRFSIRQLLLLMAVIAVALFAYREVPDMFRRTVNNDPMPLIVTNKNLIHVRQIHYLPMNHFAYRVYLPAGKKYELCTAFSNETEAFAEPELIQNLATTLDGELLIMGSIIAGQNQDERQLIVEIENRSGGFSVNFPTKQLTYKQPPVKQNHRPTGFRGTAHLPPDEQVILFRQFWGEFDNAAPVFRIEPAAAGLGLMVWIRPKPPGAKK